MPTTFANTIDNNEILAKRSQCDYAGNDIQTTYATKAEVTTGLAGKQDTISDLSDIRAGAADGATAVQPGDLATVATTGAYSDLSGTPTIPSGAQLVPAATSADADKVLTVDSQGIPGWATSGSGGGNVFMATSTTTFPELWQAFHEDGKIVYCTAGSASSLTTPYFLQTLISSDSSYTTGTATFIQFNRYSTGRIDVCHATVTFSSNHPTLGTVTFTRQLVVPANPERHVGEFLTASSNGNMVFASVNQVPASTSADADKVLTVDSQGIPGWAAGGGSSTSDVYVMDGTEPFNDIWNKYQAGTVIYYWTTKPNSSVVYEPYLVTYIKANDSTYTSGTITYTCLDRQPASLLFNLYSGYSSGNASGFSIGSKNITQLTLGGSDGQTLVFNEYGHLRPATIKQVPASTSADADKVLTVDSQGTPAWSTPAAGGVTDVEVDGTSVVSGGVASITMPTVDQTYNSASTNAQSGVAVAGALSTKQDTISDLATIRSGAADGATAVQPGDLATVATSGSYNDLSNTPTILPYKPVVAGTGVRIVNDTANNRIVVEADETVLYQAATDEGTTLQLDQYVTLSESMTHFERVRIYYAVQKPWAGKGVFESYMVDGDLKVNLHDVWYREQSGFNVWYETFTYNKYTESNLRFTQAGGVQRTILNTTWNTTSGLTTIVYKIVGVNRIASN